jgi:O-6-methylguanine DNA methyltransferase
MKVDIFLQESFWEGGRIFVASCSCGLRRISFSKKSFEKDLEKTFLSKKNGNRYSFRFEANEHLHCFFREWERYLEAELFSFETPYVLDALPPFTTKVLKACLKIPWGKVVSYKDLAIKIKHPRAARAVGQALGKNPLPILIPCHRVIASSGGWGGFSAPLSLKKRLLAKEKKEFLQLETKGSFGKRKVHP